MVRSTYAIALGSNRRHHRHGAPERVIAAATAALKELGRIVAISPIIPTPALGPAGRRFANAAVLMESDLDPAALLIRLKALEHGFGRRAGRRWGPRVLDLDIILWSGGCFAETGLTIPHTEFRKRGFVLRPLAAIVPAWRDPLTHRTIRQLVHAVDRRAPRA